MKKFLHVSLFFILCASSIYAQDSIKWIVPAIKGYGEIAYDPSFTLQPDKTLDYKVVFKVTGADEKNGVNAQLWHIARFVNLLVAGGVAKENMHLVAVISGKATPIVLDDNAYMKKYKIPNPNRELIKLLANSGVKLYICSQAMAEHNFDIQSELNPNVIKSLSALLDLAYFQLHGYAIMQ